jgi:hypothetical protein
VEFRRREINRKKVKSKVSPMRKGGTQGKEEYAEVLARFWRKEAMKHVLP